MQRISLTLTVIAAALAATAAFAAPGGGYGPGPGSGPGAGCAPDQQCGKGYGPGNGNGAGNGRGGGGGMHGTLMTEEERDAHRQKMHSFTTVGECNAYFDEHRALLIARAREQGIEPGPGPRMSPCDRMEKRGFLKPSA
jgi:hypothetical protein